MVVCVVGKQNAYNFLVRIYIDVYLFTCTSQPLPCSRSMVGGVHRQLHILVDYL